MLPALAAILAAATRASGTELRLGVSFTSLEQDGNRVRAAFSDGSSGDYDVVVGADGLRSKTRACILPGAPSPAFTGKGSWRAIVPRMPQIEHATFYIGKTAKAAVNPVSKDEMYLNVLQSLEADALLPPEMWPGALAGLLAEFSGTVGDIRDRLDRHARTVYRPVPALLVPPPRHKGNIGLIGDALHATTPHLASGAGMGVEDAIVLAEEMGRHATGEQAFSAFTARRFERCRLVVQASAQLLDYERAGTPEAKEAHGQLMRGTMRTLALPI
jgi:2-polyprenyl-6-methoxyphenol hydroxylase-like FAD-dependent oxidoreductase